MCLFKRRVYNGFRIKYQVYLVGLIMITLMCKSCGCKDQPTILIPEDIKRYTDFPAGSWWVYENQANLGVIDSIYYEERNVDILKGGTKECFFWEEIVIKGKWYLADNAEKLVYNLFYTPLFEEHEFYYMLFNNTLLFYPNEIGEESRFGSQMLIADKREKQVINGAEYTNTITTFHPNSSYLRSEIYAEGVGVVQRIYADSSVFVLKEYFINY